MFNYLLELATVLMKTKSPSIIVLMSSSFCPIGHMGGIIDTPRDSQLTMQQNQLLHSMLKDTYSTSYIYISIVL